MRVIVNSLPKSGTHLVGKLFDNLGLREYEPGLTGALLRETHRNPIRNLLKRKRRPKNNSNGLWIDLDVTDNLICRHWFQKHLSLIPDGSYVSAHLPYSNVLSDFFQSHRFRIVHIIRDPRDVLVSYMNFQKNSSKFPFHKEYSLMNTDEIIDHIFTDIRKRKVVSASLKSRIVNGLGWLNDPSVYSTSFEKLIGTKGGGNAEIQEKIVNEICEYLGINLSRNRILEISELVFDCTSETFNKGKIGQWKTVLNEKQKSLVNIKLKSLLKEMGYA